MTQAHLDKFWRCFQNLPDQPADGRSPQVYLAEMNKLGNLTLAWPTAHPTGKLTRDQLRNLCRDPKVDVLIAYAAVMAWGGKDMWNYRLNLRENSIKNLIKILTKLRTSTNTRETDFSEMQQAAENIKGLGISFYTKLLFFFRDKADAYILDQFTAKSANLLFNPCPVVLNSSGYPDPDNTPASYAWFCSAVETLGSSRTPIWTGEQVEQAMFNVQKGSWREYLRSIYGKPEKATPPVPPQVTEGEAPTHADGDSLPARVARTHAAAYQDGCELPGVNPQVGNALPICIHCRLIDGVIWQYTFQKKSIHAQVFIPANHIARYDKLRRSLGVEGHDFGDGILGNGAANGQTRSLKLTVPRGLNAPQNEWDEIADQVVSAMSILFSRVCENL